MLTKEELAPMIDHTNLRVSASQKDIEELCEEAMWYHFGAVCVRENNVDIAYRLLRNSPVKIAAVVGFPTEQTVDDLAMITNLARYTTAGKCREAVSAITNGATGIDMVINLGSMKIGDYRAVEDDIQRVVKAANNVPVKVIIETCYLTDEEKATACGIATQAGARYVKTSTGFGPFGAKINDVELMSGVLPIYVGIKASGYIDSVQYAAQLYEASQKHGLHRFRVGASKLVNEYRR